jgi:hypothetical protein
LKISFLVQYSSKQDVRNYINIDSNLAIGKGLSVDIAVKKDNAILENLDEGDDFFNNKFL